MVKTTKIKKIQFLKSKIFSFLKYWEKNVVEEINVDGNMIKSRNLFPLLESVIIAYESNTTGYSLLLGDHELFSCADETIFLKTLNIIWKNPDVYFEITKDLLNRGETYYSYFLSELKVRIVREGKLIPCHEYFLHHLEHIKIWG